MELVVAPVAVFLSVLLLMGSLLRSGHTGVASRVRRYAGTAVADAETSSAPFTRRVLLPAFEGMGRRLASAAPAQAQVRLKEALDHAGNPVTINVLFALRGVAMIGLPLIYLVLIHPAGQGFGLLDAGISLLLFSLGGYLPKRWLSAVARKRQRAIERALPDTLDLVVVSMEAGLTLDGALAKVVEKTVGPLRDELRRTLHEIELGRARRDSLRRLGSRTGVQDLIALINSIVQADQMGVSLAQVMRTQASEARLKRRQRAEERAHQAAVKMLFPLVVCILPSVMIVTIGPAALAIYAQFSKGIFN